MIVTISKTKNRELENIHIEKQCNSFPEQKRKRNAEQNPYDKFDRSIRSIL